MESQTLPRPLLANVSFVTTRLAVGGDLAYDDDLAARQLVELVELGVTHIVDVRVEASDEDLVRELAPEITYVHLGIDDRHGHVVPDTWFDRGTATIAEVLRQDAGVVVAHCHMGINRGPSMGLAALLATDWDLEEALDAIRTARPIAAIGYADQALNWHHRRTDTPAADRSTNRTRLAAWQAVNGIDVNRIIRRVRALESRGVPVTPDLYDQISD